MPLRRLRTARFFWLALYALSLAHCTWEPLTRPIVPEPVLEGDIVAIQPLESDGRRVFVEERIGESTRWHLVETDKLTSCLLPEGRPLVRALYAPRFQGEDVPKVLFPIRRRVGESDELWLSDEKCRMRGPYGPLGSRDPDLLQLRDDYRLVLLIYDRERSLRLFDPWTESTRPLATNVSRWAAVARSESGPRAREPEALWIVESGRLTQRGLDGTLLVSMGEKVVDFDQRVSADNSRLHVAFQDGTEVFEAVSPDYAPVRIATDACGPGYAGEVLEVHTPVVGDCRTSQLVRVEGGQARFFAPGVYRVIPQGNVSLQFVRSESGGTEVWFARDAGPPLQLTPTPLSAMVILDGLRLSGRTTEGRFGFWSLRSGYQEVVTGVDDIVTFRIDRSSQHRWLLFHEVRDGLGTLSTFTERDADRALQSGQPLALTKLAEGVPRGTYAWRSTPFLQEPIVLSYDQARVQLDEEGNVVHWVGTLHARLLSGSLGSRIDENVTHSTLVLAPLPGVLYAVTEGTRRGLWFAAL